MPTDRYLPSSPVPPYHDVTVLDGADRTQLTVSAMVQLARNQTERSEYDAQWGENRCSCR